jgi:type I restriction enzyme S subunit
MAWTSKPIGEAVEQMKTGSTPPTSQPEFFNGLIPWFTPGDIGGTRDLTKSTRFITEAGIKVGKAKLFDKGMLLVTCIGDIGRVGVLQQPSSANQQITALKFKNDIDVYYAYYWFIAHRGCLERFANLAVVPILNNEGLKEIEFFYPPIPEQRRIADRLAKADRLRRLRRYANQLGETYLQSVFVEMFGNISRNEKGWEIVTLKKLVRSKDTINYGVVQPGDDFPGGIPIVRVGDFDDIPENTKGLKRIDPQIEADYKRSRLKGDEILIACVGSIGKVTLVDTRLMGFNIVRATARVPVGDFINRLFLATYLKTQFVQDYFTKETRTVSQPTLNIEHIEETPVPLPPISLQERFAAIVQRYERLRAQGREAERQAELLFQSLLNQNFGGQL